MISSDQLVVVRSWVSDKSPPTDNDLGAIFSRVGTLKGTVQEVLRKRLATFQEKPAQFAVPGDYSQTRAANIQSLEKTLTKLEGYTDDLSGLIPTSDTLYRGVQVIRRKNRR